MAPSRLFWNSVLLVGIHSSNKYEPRFGPVSSAVVWGILTSPSQDRSVDGSNSLISRIRSKYINQPNRINSNNFSPTIVLEQFAHRPRSGFGRTISTWNIAQYSHPSTPLQVRRFTTRPILGPKTSLCGFGIWLTNKAPSDRSPQDLVGSQMHARN